MGFILVVGSIALGLFVASKAGPWWGLLAGIAPFGVFTVGGLLVGGLTHLVQPGWPEFVNAWEKEIGRVPVTIPGDQLTNIKSAFNAWRSDRQRTHESARDWIRRAMQAAMGGEQRMAGYGNPTGPDYLIGAAQKWMDDGDAPPFVDAFQDMVTTLVLKGSPMADPNKVVADWPIAEHQAAAIAVFGEATRVAFERRDWESMEEMLAFGLPLILKFDRYLRETGRLPTR